MSVCKSCEMPGYFIKKEMSLSVIFLIVLDHAHRYYCTGTFLMTGPFRKFQNFSLLKMINLIFVLDT